MPEHAVSLSSADRVLFPDDGVTKGDLFSYYDRVAEGIPHAWIRRVKHAIRTLAWRYNADGSSLMEFDAAGNLVGHWGGAGQGYDWPIIRSMRRSAIPRRSCP